MLARQRNMRKGLPCPNWVGGGRRLGRNGLLLKHVYTIIQRIEPFLTLISFVTHYKYSIVEFEESSSLQETMVRELTGR